MAEELKYYTRPAMMAEPYDENREVMQARHRRYYAQLAFPPVKQLVAQRIGMKRLNASTDSHFNDIPLPEWDGLHESITFYCASFAKIHMQDNNWSKSNSICVAKEAARQLLEAQNG